MKLKAFTLVETLVAISIISLLAGILLPVVITSKKSALKVDEINKLHQLGIAGAMYHDSWGEWPLDTYQLVSSKLVPPEICLSLRDTTPDGIANELVDFTNRRGVRYAAAPAIHTDYKNTFVGPADFGLTQKVMHDWIESGPNSGWLTDSIDSARTGFPTPTQWKGIYKRLLFDGSVVTRIHEDYACYNGGKRQPCRISALLFVDPNPVIEELQRSTDH